MIAHSIWAFFYRFESKMSLHSLDQVSVIGMLPEALEIFAHQIPWLDVIFDHGFQSDVIALSLQLSIQYKPS